MSQQFLRYLENEPPLLNNGAYLPRSRTQLCASQVDFLDFPQSGKNLE